jgi:hypothetical protein
VVVGAFDLDQTLRSLELDLGSLGNFLDGIHISGTSGFNQSFPKVDTEVTSFDRVVRHTVSAIFGFVSGNKRLVFRSIGGLVIVPGNQLILDDIGANTANFIFSDGANTYIGQAAHCSSTGSNTDTDGCQTQSLPLGTPVTILGANHPGTLAYNSWIAMQAAGEKDANTCAYNDLALIKIDSEKPLPFVNLQNISPNLLGQTVIVVGNALRLLRTR